LVGLLNDVTEILPRSTVVAMATKFETKWAITQLVLEISQRCLRLVGVFRHHAVKWCQRNSTTSDFCFHGNEISDKSDYNSACMTDFSETFASNRSFTVSSYQTMSDEFYNDRPWLPWQPNLTQNKH